MTEEELKTIRKRLAGEDGSSRLRRRGVPQVSSKMLRSPAGAFANGGGGTLLPGVDGGDGGEPGVLL